MYGKSATLLCFDPGVQVWDGSYHQPRPRTLIFCALFTWLTHLTRRRASRRFSCVRAGSQMDRISEAGSLRVPTVSSLYWDLHTG